MPIGDLQNFSQLTEKNWETENKKFTETFKDHNGILWGTDTELN